MTDQTVPTFLVVGAARSGTTGLVEGLRTNSQVFVTDPKEPHYFALHGAPVDFQGPGDARDDQPGGGAPTSDAYLALYPQSGLRRSTATARCRRCTTTSAPFPRYCASTRTCASS